MKTIKRLQKARLIAQMNLTKVLDRYADGKAKTVLVPGTDGKTYNVIIKRRGKAIFTTCRLQTGAGDLRCEGNPYHTCYHSVAAILTAAFENDIEASICSSESVMKHTKNLRGKNARSYQVNGGGSPIWLVMSYEQIGDDENIICENGKSIAENIKELGY